jgi:hypothetical protein
MADNDKHIITAEQAIDCLPQGETIHNFLNPSPGLMLGCDYERASAIKALEEADSIEIGGPGCMAMKHPLVVWKDGAHSFFEADMDKIDALEAVHKERTR